MSAGTRVVVDQDRCVGHGVCEVVAEELFEVGDDGLSHVLADPVPTALAAAAADAVAQCPARALRQA